MPRKSDVVLPSEQSVLAQVLILATPGLAHLSLPHAGSGSRRGRRCIASAVDIRTQDQDIPEDR